MLPFPFKCDNRSPLNESRKIKASKECIGDTLGKVLDDEDLQNHGKLSGDGRGGP